MTLRRLAPFSAALALCLAVSMPAPAQQSQYQDYSHARIVRVTVVEGDVQVHRPGATEWQQALPSLPIRQGYALSTSNGRAEVELESGATIRLAENTSIEFTELALGDGARITRIALTQGTAAFYANLASTDLFRVTTPYLEVGIHNDARFRLDVLDGSSRVSVWKGDVLVAAAGESYRLAKGRSLLFPAGDAQQVVVAANAEADEFDRWVADLDEVIPGRSRAQAGLRYAGSSAYGSSAYSHGYGFSAGFNHYPRPYFQRRWVYIYGRGWVLLGYTPCDPFRFNFWGDFQQWWGFGGWSGYTGGYCPVDLSHPYIPGHNVHGGSGSGVVIVNNPTGGNSGGTTGGMPGNPGNPGRPGIRPRNPDLTDPTGHDDPLPPLIERGRDSLGEDGLVITGSRPTPAESDVRPVRPARPVGGVPSGIVYDPNTNQYVNNPREPVRTERPMEQDEPRPAVVGRPLVPATPDQPAPISNDSVAVRPTPQAPVRPADVDRPEPSRPGAATVRPDPPQPRVDNPRPAPQPRVEPTRPTPPPRAETPRPTPPPRAEPQRPSPPPPRAEPRPSPPPRVDPPRPAPAPRPEAARPPSPPPSRGEAAPVRPRPKDN